jgi:hypothetical protein
MRIGLYSEIARRHIVAARGLIAERGYDADADGIRRFRQDILRSDYVSRWRQLVACPDFYSTSGCRALVFNVQEHRLTLPAIRDFLAEQRLTFDGFELAPDVLDRFRHHFPEPRALLDLRAWSDYEAAHPETFRSMYVFSVSRHAA